MSTAERAPEPLVPAACTMAGNDWYPLHFDRLRKSKWWRRASDLARARNVMLWGEAYKQQPAGSMPDDDDDLAEAAGFGMDVEAFISAKAEIMAPWVLCSDGRWYHPTVCEVVLEAWERASERRKAAAEKKAAQRAKTRGHGAPRAAVPTENVDVPSNSTDVPGDTPENGGDIRTHNRQDSTDRKEPPEVPQGGQRSSTSRVRKADVEAIWSEAPKTARERSSKADVERSLNAAVRRGRAVVEVRAGLLLYWSSEQATKDGGAFVKGVHRMIEGDRWESFAEPLPSELPLAAPPPDPWPSRIREYQRNAYWNRLDWGPPPGKPGCTLSPEAQMAHGYTPATTQTQTAA